MIAFCHPEYFLSVCVVTYLVALVKWASSSWIRGRFSLYGYSLVDNISHSLRHSVAIWFCLGIFFMSLQLTVSSPIAEGNPADGTWKTGSECPSCLPRSNPTDPQENEWKELKIELTKRQILDRLEMMDRPKVKRKPVIPAEILAEADSAAGEEMYSDTRQIILFPSQTSPPRRRHASNDSLLKFTLTYEMRQMALQSAVFWKAFHHHDNSTSVSWQSVDVTETVDQQIESRGQDRYITLPLDTRIHAQFQHHKPYLVIKLNPFQTRTNVSATSHGHQRQMARSKRSTTPTCTSTITECCRDSLYISFRQVGWDDWILSPQGFHAYYCRGSCRTPTAVTNSASPHASLLQRLLSRGHVPSSVRSHFSACCAPTRLSSLTVFYSDDNDVMKQKVLPNMIVESCGCAL